MRTLKGWIVACCIAPCLSFTWLDDEVVNPPPATDYTLHTLYIFNFTKYVEWPSGSKAVKIGLVDNPEAEAALQRMAQAKSTGGSELKVINTRNEAELGACQIIFIPSNSTPLTGKLIEHFNAAPVLIVTEEADLTRRGASISFKMVSGKLRFQINEEVIKSKGMKISGSLVSLAEK